MKHSFVGTLYIEDACSVHIIYSKLMRFYLVLIPLSLVSKVLHWSHFV